MICLQKLLIPFSIINSVQALEDDSTSMDAMIRNVMRLLVGALGFVLLLLICVAVHVGSNACKAYMREKRYQKREAKVIQDSY